MACSASNESALLSYHLWHEKLGHPSFNTTLNLLRCYGISTYFVLKEYAICNSCQLAKAHKFPFLASYDKAIIPFFGVP